VCVSESVKECVCLCVCMRGGSDQLHENVQIVAVNVCVCVCVFESVKVCVCMRGECDQLHENVQTFEGTHKQAHNK